MPQRRRRFPHWIPRHRHRSTSPCAHASSVARACLDRYGGAMATWKPDPTFYPSARMAMQAPPEKLAYMAILNVEGTQPDALGVVDLDPQSSTYGELIHRVP